MVTVRISELFNSIQGEGIYSGVPMVFIRFQGCSLGCGWCDTKYTWPEESKRMKTYTVPLLLKELEYRRDQGLKWTCITGGEPLEQPEAFGQLVQGLRRLDFQIEVETSGLVELPYGTGLLGDYCNPFEDVHSWVVDLKCPGSEAVKKPVLGDLRRLRPQDQLKAVVKDQEDLQFVKKTLLIQPTKAQVLISPVFDGRGKLNTEWAQTVAGFCIKEGYRLSLQIHKFLWGMKRGV